MGGLYLNSINENDIHACEVICELPAGVPERFLAGGAFLFAAYGCALTERQTTSGMYVYTAVNLATGKTEILGRRKKRLAADSFGDMAAKISTLSIRGDGRLNIERKPGESAKRSELTDVLKQIFNEILPMYGYVIREKQIELAEHMLDIAGQCAVTLAESEVGTGKTLAYLITVILVKRGRLNDYRLRGRYSRQSWAESAYMPVVISTSSIALQNAIVKDYIPELSRILLRHGIISTPVTAVIRKGREHYICERRLMRYYNNADAGTRTLLRPFTGTGAIFDLTSADSLTPNVKRGICVSGKCSDDCPYARKCRYINHMKEANDPQIDFQITNHNYFLADTLHRAKGMKPLLPHYQLVVIDEAHKFLAAARSMYGVELTGGELPELTREIHTFTLGKSDGGVNVHRLAKQMEEQNRKLFSQLYDNVPEPETDDDAERFPAVMDGEVCRYLKKLSAITGDLAAAVSDSRVQTLYRERQARAVWKLDMVGERIDALRERDSLVLWLEKRVAGEVETAALCAIPKDLNERLYDDIWCDGIPIILTSGTLSAGGDFTRTKETLGLDLLSERRLSDTTMPSPFDHRNNALLYISEDMPFPDNKDKEYIAAVANEIVRLVIASHGHAAVLFTSYNAMGQVYTLLKKHSLPFPLYRLERGGVHAIERFKKSGGGILLASGALWEGIDIPGDALSMLIIVKLPFAVPDPIGDYERSLCGSMELYKTRCVVPDMLVKLKQGFGRLIRTESDTGAVALLDSRVSTRGAYRACVLAALPPCRVTSNICDVRRFIHDKKPGKYFITEIPAQR